MSFRREKKQAMAITKILNLNSIVTTKVHIAHVTSELSLDIISFFQKKRSRCYC